VYHERSEHDKPAPTTVRGSSVNHRSRRRLLLRRVLGPHFVSHGLVGRLNVLFSSQKNRWQAVKEIVWSDVNGSATMCSYVSFTRMHERQNRGPLPFKTFLNNRVRPWVPVTCHHEKSKNKIKDYARVRSNVTIVKARIFFKWKKNLRSRLLVRHNLGGKKLLKNVNTS